MAQEIVYKSNRDINRLQVGVKHFDAEVVTYIIKHTYLFGLIKFYKIKQIAPLIKNPFYDGEYETNRILNTILRIERINAEIALIDIKRK